MNIEKNEGKTKELPPPHTQLNIKLRQKRDCKKKRNDVLKKRKRNGDRKK